MSENKSKLFCISNDFDLEPLGDGVSRQIMLHDDEVMMVKVSFEKGAIGYEHDHPHRQISYIASGVFEVAIDKEKKVLKKGDAFYIPPNVKHGVLCIESGLLIDVFNPMREDFI